MNSRWMCIGEIESRVHTLQVARYSIVQTSTTLATADGRTGVCVRRGATTRDASGTLAATGEQLRHVGDGTTP
eukprot:m.114776 g.114776  ORF g.114776 m.114776 type:complete len:73 (+) comp17124_c0_seq1:128-346(+)